MEFRDLEIYLAVVRTHSFTAAAEQCYLSQPAVSVAVKRLEDELAVALLDRKRGAVKPTRAGSLLAGHAAELLAGRDTARWEIGRYEGLESGELRLGTTDAVSVYLLPDAYRDFRERYPNVALRVWVDDSARLGRAVQEGELDLAVLTLPPPLGGLVTQRIHSERLVAVVAGAHPLASPARPRSSRVSAEPMIGYPARSVTRRLIDAALRAVDIEPHVAMEMGAPEAMKRLVEVGLGYAVLPESLVATEIADGRLARLAVSRFRAARELGFAHASGRTLSPSARAFVDLALARLSTRATRTTSMRPARPSAAAKRRRSRSKST